MTKPTSVEEAAQNIQDFYFACGARIGHSDWLWIKEKVTTIVEQTSMEAVIAVLKEQVKVVDDSTDGNRIHECDYMQSITDIKYSLESKIKEWEGLLDSKYV